MLERPTTSVIIPVSNGEAFIRDAITSVLTQLGVDDEVIVVDDGSVDRTGALVANCDPRVRVFSCGGKGPSAARNVGLLQVRGDLIAFLDHDDLWPEGRHDALLKGLADNPDANAAVGRVRIKAESAASADNYLALDGRHAPSLLMSCLYRRSLIAKVGLFDEALRYGEDMDYYVRLADAGMVLVHCNHDALVYRRHAGNATNASFASNKTLLKILALRLRRTRAATKVGPR